MSTIAQQMDPTSVARLLDFGTAVRLLSSTSAHPMSLREAYAWLWPPILLGQIEFLFVPHLGVVAFAAWAFFSTEALSDFVSQRSPPALEDWNDGDQLCIVCCASPYGRARELVARLRSRFAAEYPQVTTLRWDRTNSRAVRQMLRTSPSVKPNDYA